MSAQHPSRRTKGCPMCKAHKHKGGGADRVPWAVKRRLGQARRIQKSGNDD